MHIYSTHDLTSYRDRYSRALGNQTREGFNILSRRVSITRVKRAQNVNGSNIPNWISKKGGRNVFRGEDFARIMVSGRIQWRKPRSPFIKKPPSPPRDKISRENRRVGRRYIDGKIRYPRRQPFHRWRGESNRKIFDNNEFGLSVDPNRKWISIWIYIYIYEQYNGWSTLLDLWNYTSIIHNHISLDLLAYFCREEFVERERFSRLFTTYNDYFQRPLELGN